MGRVVCSAPVKMTGSRSAVGNVSGCRCVSDCRSRDREFDPGPVQNCLLPSTDSRRVVVSYAGERKQFVVRLTNRPDMTIAVDWAVKLQTKPKMFSEDGTYQTTLKCTHIHRTVFYFRLHE